MRVLHSADRGYHRVVFRVSNPYNNKAILGTYAACFVHRVNLPATDKKQAHFAFDLGEAISLFILSRLSSFQIVYKQYKNGF